MIRALSLFGLAALFFAVSPGLRHQLMVGLGAFVGVMTKYSPVSYVVGGLVLFLVFIISLNSSTRPR